MIHPRQGKLRAGVDADTFLEPFMHHEQTLIPKLTDACQHPDPTVRMRALHQFTTVLPQVTDAALRTTAVVMIKARYLDKDPVPANATFPMTVGDRAGRILRTLEIPETHWWREQPQISPSFVSHAWMRGILLAYEAILGPTGTQTLIQMAGLRHLSIHYPPATPLHDIERATLPALTTATTGPAVVGAQRPPLRNLG